MPVKKVVPRSIPPFVGVAPRLLYSGTICEVDRLQLRPLQPALQAESPQQRRDGDHHQRAAKPYPRAVPATILAVS